MAQGSEPVSARKKTVLLVDDDAAVLDAWAGVS